MSKRILRVDMTKLEAKFEDFPADFAALGGRALTSTIVSKEVDPLCHPLG